MIALAVASLVAGLCESGVLAILAESAAALVNGTSNLHFDIGSVHISSSIGGLLAIGIGLALVRVGLQIVLASVPARIGVETQARLRSELFAAFEHATWEHQSRDREGYLQELLTNHVAQATNAVTWTAALMISLLTFLVLVISAFTLNVFAALLVLATAGALSLALRPLVNLGSRRAKALSQGFMAYAGGVNEAVRIAEETHIFGTQDALLKRTDELVAAMRSPYFQMGFLSGLVPGLYQSLIYLFVVVALICLHVLGATHVASLGAVVLLLVRAGSYGQQAQSSLQSVVQAQPYIERVEEARRRYEASTPAPGVRSLDTVRTLAFENVSFAYDINRPALTEISFEVLGGEVVGIVGPTGAGKSTLVQILLGLRVPVSGQYLVNGIPEAQIDRAAWRKRFAYLPQEPKLLHASVADNIRFFRQIDENSVERAARMAGVHEEVIAWPSGYDTTVGPRADAISGGQQQRICLARALAADPQVLVLDEPTSALDPRAEQLIQESLLGLKGNVTLIIVAHRMSTLEICERVMVILGGRLDAFDQISQLRESNAYYRSAVSAHAIAPPEA